MPVHNQAGVHLALIGIPLIGVNDVQVAVELVLPEAGVVIDRFHVACASYLPMLEFYGGLQSVKETPYSKPVVGYRIDHTK